MRILISSHAFAPDVGGIETVSDILAHEFVSCGHDVKLITQTRESDGRDPPFEVIRRPKIGRLWVLTRWSDILWQNGISLRAAWPAIVQRKPWFITHTGFRSNFEGTAYQKALQKIKYSITRRAHNIAICAHMRRELPRGTSLIGNPYNESVFHFYPGIERANRLLFAGRLVPEKGLGILLHALHMLHQEGVRLSLDVVGTGAAKSKYEALAGRLGLTAHVRFKGVISGVDLTRTMNAHSILVAPSTYQEGFGVVALEAIACGCVVIASHTGGLPDTIGPCGVTFPGGDFKALAALLRELLSQPTRLSIMRDAAAAHLARFTPHGVARQYLDVFSPFQVDANHTSGPGGCTS
jgi:glycogen(starch) synthase